MKSKFILCLTLAVRQAALISQGAEVRLLNTHRDGDSIHFSFQTEASQKYVLEGIASLDARTWSSIATYAGTGGQLEVSKNVKNDSSQFYKVTRQPAAAIYGRVTLTGDPPREIPIPFDPLCGRLHSVDATTRFYVVGQDKGLADVFVSITQGLEGQSFAVSPTSALIDQVGCFYSPYVSGLQVGQTLVIRNSDPLLHNVHVFPAAPGNKESNRAQLPKARDLEYSFTTPEVFLRIKCDVHPWQFAYVGVVAHPFFAVTDANGNFELPGGLPPGTYTLEAYHRKAGRVSQVFTIGVGDATELNFTLSVPN